MLHQRLSCNYSILINASAQVRADDRTKFRIDEYVYFRCSDTEAVLNDGSGMNVYELQCESSGFNPSWPTCYIEPTCDNLPVPSDASKMRKATVGNKVKLGEKAVYECIDRADFYETSSVSANLGHLSRSFCNPVYQLVHSFAKSSLP